jgi:type IV pilus assembly protein PilB
MTQVRLEVRRGDELPQAVSNSKDTEGNTELQRSLRLGDILVGQGVMTEAQLARSLRFQSETGARLGEVVTHFGYVSPAQLSEALAWQSMYGLSALAELLPNPNISSVLTEKFCRARLVLPVDIDSDHYLILAMVDPGDVATIDDVRLITGMQVRAVASTRAAISEAWDIVYANRAQLESAEQQEELQTGPSDHEVAQYETVVSLVEKIMVTAVRRKATDIHFEPAADKMVVRLRTDGVMHQLTEIRSTVKQGVVSRIKVMADMDIAEKRVPQDGRASLRIDDRVVDLRIASIPTVFGEAITVRVLDSGGLSLTLEALGMEEDELLLFREAIRRPWGEVLITGPTGSGKSTTLYAGLREVNDPSLKIYTVEDPVERRMPGIVQSQIHSAIGVTFATMLRSLLRSDPNVIMIGEIRDHETAQIVTEASLTGHLVLSTLHTNDAPTAITRLLEMGLPGYLIASTLELVVAQRLARRLCPRCKETVKLGATEMTQEDRDFLGAEATTIARAVGCNVCYNTGYSGRIGLFEVLPITSEIRHLILEHATVDAIREHARASGIRSLLDDGRRKVLAGLTTIEEVQRVTI